MLLNSAVKRVKLYSHRGDQSVTTDSITSDIVLAINDARRRLIRRVPKRFFWKKASTPLTTSAGDYEYDLASDVQEPICFFYTNNGSRVNLSKIPSDKEWNEKVFDPSDPQGRPLYYREVNNAGTKAIELAPIPDAAYTINYEYYKNVSTELTTSNLSTEIPDIPDYLQDVLWIGALALFLKAFDDPAVLEAKEDYRVALVEFDIADEQDQDEDVAFRWGRRRRPVDTGLEGFRQE